MSGEFGRILSAFAQLLQLGRSAIDFISDFLFLSIEDNSILSFICAKIAAVAVDGLLFAGL